MPRARGARASLAGVFETTYGTAPASGFVLLPFASSALSMEQPLLESELLGFGRDPLPPTLDVNTVDGDIVVPIDAENFGTWLKAAFGDPVTSGSGPYTHVFSSGVWDLPSLALETGKPDASAFDMHAGLRLNTMAFTMQRTGQLQATVGLVGQSETTAATSQAGTPTQRTLTRFGQRQGSITLDDAPIANIETIGFNYSNNLDVIPTIRSDGNIEDADASLASLGLEMVARFDGPALLNLAKAGTPVDIDLTFSNGTQSLAIAIPRVYLPVPRREIGGPNGVQVTYSGFGAQASGGGAMVTATLINTTASY